jgi:hypothetical protein
MQGEVSKFVEQPQTISWARFPQHRASLPKHGLQNRSIYSNCLSDLQTGLPKARWWLWWSKYGLEAQKFTKVMKLDGFSLVGSFKYLNICHVPSYCLILRESMRFWDLSQGFPIYRCSQRTTPPFIGDFQGCAGAKPAALQLSWKQRFGSSARAFVSPGFKTCFFSEHIIEIQKVPHASAFACHCSPLLAYWKYQTSKHIKTHQTMFFLEELQSSSGLCCSGSQHLVSLSWLERLRRRWSHGRHGRHGRHGLAKERMRKAALDLKKVDKIIRENESRRSETNVSQREWQYDQYVTTKSSRHEIKDKQCKTRSSRQSPKTLWSAFPS